jgi:transposase
VQRSTTIAAGLARRGKIILLLAAGFAQSAVAQAVGVQRTVVRQWVKRFVAQRVDGLVDAPGRGAKGGFPPEVAIHLVRLACERPDLLSRRLSQWDGPELARQLIAEGNVADISASTVRRILAAHQLKPWRHHRWLHPKHPRDAACYATITQLIDLYTRPLRADERVLSLDEKTSLPPRPRPSLTRPAPPYNLPNRVEHEYKRAGALHLVAAFDTRSGKV